MRCSAEAEVRLQGDGGRLEILELSPNRTQKTQKLSSPWIPRLARSGSLQPASPAPQAQTPGKTRRAQRHRFQWISAAFIARIFATSRSAPPGFMSAGCCPDSRTIDSITQGSFCCSATCYQVPRLPASHGLLAPNSKRAIFSLHFSSTLWLFSAAKVPSLQTLGY